MSPRGEEERRKLTGNLEEAVGIVGIQLGHVIHGLNVEIPITRAGEPPNQFVISHVSMRLEHPMAHLYWAEGFSLSLLPLRPRFDQVINILSQRHSSTRSDGNTNDGDVCRALCE